MELIMKMEYLYLEGKEVCKKENIVIKGNA